MRIHELEVERVPVADLQQHPRNPHNGDPESIEESMEVNGLYKPILVQRSTGYILAGNHTYMAALSAGLQQMPVIYLDVSDAEATRIMVADNATSRRGNDDPAILAEVLNELYASDPGLGGTGFDFDEFQRLNAELNVPVDFEDMTPREPKLDKVPFAELVLVPSAEEDGTVHEIMLARADFGAISLGQFREIRAQLNLMPISRDELDAYEIEDWVQR